MGTAPVTRRLYHRGAEADLYLSWLGPWEVIIKRRVPKKYRNRELDSRIRRERTAREAMALHQARTVGVRTPVVLELDLQQTSITMTRVEGVVVRNNLDSIDSNTARRVFHELGWQIGLLHKAGIIHGDLTTSNIIVSTKGVPYVFDFGMSSHSFETEDRGVDIHLLKKSIATSHSINPEPCAKAVFGGYKISAGVDEARRSFGKAAEVSRRGRYFAIR